MGSVQISGDLPRIEVNLSGMGSLSRTGFPSQEKNRWDSHQPKKTGKVRPLGIRESTWEAKEVPPKTTGKDAESNVSENKQSFSENDPKKGASLFVVTSGKGGVGKTTLSVNLSVELASRGLRTMLVDADLGLANAHILMGVRPSLTLTDYLEDRCTVSEILAEGPCGLKLISGGQGIKEMADLDAAGRRRILDAILDLRAYADVIIIDTGAGVSSTVTDFVEAADQTIVVTNANFTAIANAYGIIKVVVQDGYDQPIHLVVNRARSPEEAEQVCEKLTGCTQKFLEMDISYLGLVPEDPRVNRAIQKRTPFTQLFPDSTASQYMKKLVDRIEKLSGQGIKT